MNTFLTLCTVLLVAVAAGVLADKPHCNAANSWEVFPDPRDCANFYRCEHNKPVLHTCVENTLYDKQLKACNWDHLVDCNANPNLPANPALVCPKI